MSKLSIRISVQPFMYRMHALYIVELALTSHSRLCGIEVVREEDSFSDIPLSHHTREVQIATTYSTLRNAAHPLHSRLQTSTLLDECHKQLLRAPLHLHLLLPRELQPLPEVHPVLLSGAHCVPSVGSQQLLRWVQCGVHHPQPDEVCELPVYCHRKPQQPEGKPC